MLAIADIYENCRRKIGYGLGYIPQQIAGEWAANQVAVIMHELNSSRRDHVERGICQLYISTLCLAHEYYIPLSKAYSGIDLPDTIQGCIDLFKSVDISEWGENLGELVNNLYSRIAYYHGWPKPGTDKTLSSCIADVHKAIYTIAAHKKIDLARVLPGFVSDSRNQTGVVQFRRSYSPVTTPVLDFFHKIKDNSVCLYAKNSNAWGALPPPLGDELKRKENLHAFLRMNIETFSRLSRATKYESVDAFLIMLPAEMGGTIDRLSDTVYEVLSFFSDNDPQSVNCMERVGDSKWRYEFCGMKYFVQSFGSCYNADNTRYTYGVDRTFIQFVSEAAFHRAVPREKWQKTREVIREKAKNTGQPYDVHEHDADTFVHNLRAGMLPVKWHKKDEKLAAREGTYD